MTKFFVPAATTDELRDKTWNSFRQFAKETTGWDSTDKKIFKINFMHNGKQYEAEVGQKTSINKELVCAIFETTSVYLICTINRGVVRGEPILVGKQDTRDIITFD